MSIDKESTIGLVRNRTKESLVTLNSLTSVYSLGTIDFSVEVALLQIAILRPALRLVRSSATSRSRWLLAVSCPDLPFKFTKSTSEPETANRWTTSKCPWSPSICYSGPSTRTRIELFANYYDKDKLWCRIKSSPFMVFSSLSMCTCREKFAYYFQMPAVNYRVKKKLKQCESYYDLWTCSSLKHILIIYSEIFSFAWSLDDF